MLDQDIDSTQLALPFDSSYTVNTLSGPVSGGSLGKVLMHEHVFCRIPSRHIFEAHNYLTSQFSALKKHGVNTIVDLTTYVLPDKYVEILNRLNINVICCAGYYLISKVPGSYRKLDAEGLADKLRSKVANGIGSYKVKPGIIKVASSGKTLTRFEKNALQASAMIQAECKLPIATHACRGGRKQLEVLLDAGANPAKLFISHMEMELKGKDATPLNQLINDVLWILSKGAYIFIGDFAANASEYRKQVLKLLKTCCDAGYKKQIFIGTDSYWMYRRGKIQVRGSNPNATFPRNYQYTFSLIIPYLLASGFSESDIGSFIVQNPRLFFSPNNS